MGLLLGLLLTIPIPAAAVHTGDTASTRIGPSGLYSDVVVDAARARLYATDASSYDVTNPAGLVVIELTTHREITRLPFPDLTGVALSPSGAKLLVGSRDGYLRVIDPATLQVTRSQFFYGEPFTAAYMWDMAFDGEDRAVISQGTASITCEGFALAVDLSTMTKIAELRRSPCGVGPYSGVRIHSGLGRIYVLGNSRVSTFYLSNFTNIGQFSDSGFTVRAEFTPDGRNLVFSSGAVYDAATLVRLADAGHSGDVAIDRAGARAYFSRGPIIDVIRLSDFAFVDQFVFGGHFANIGPLLIRGIAIDDVRGVAYVLDAEGTNGNALHAVPLVAAFLDPFPADGEFFPTDYFPANAIVSGGINLTSVRVVVDGSTVAHLYNATYHLVAYVPSPRWTQGLHRIAISATDASGRGRWLNWSFTVDLVPPEILVEAPAPVYRTPNAIVRGRIVDASPVTATANGLPVALDPSTGAFAVSIALEQGGNLLSLIARDRAGNVNVTAVWVLHVPPTTRYIDADAAFSIEYPSNWTVTRDVVVSGVRLEAVIRESSGANVNIIAYGGPLTYTEAGLLQAAAEAEASVSRLPGYAPAERPRPISVPGLVAATYAFEWTANGTRVYQRQMIATDPSARHAWILTFTAPALTALRYDPLYLWMAVSLRAEAGPSSPAVYFVTGAIAATAAAVGAVVYLDRRRNARGRSPMPPQSAPPGGGPTPRSESIGPEAPPSLPPNR